MGNCAGGPPKEIKKLVSPCTCLRVPTSWGMSPRTQAACPIAARRSRDWEVLPSFWTATSYVGHALSTNLYD